MRITRLSLAGFGPYKNEQSVDFEEFADDGIFLMTGKTGAGKSSILDAICFALYATIPRYEGGQQRLRSDHCEPGDPTWVELEFTVGGTDYRVRRSPEFERPKQRGEGLTRSPATAELFQRVGETWEGLSARPVDVGNDLARIVGLSRDQFLQVILLAQNRFQQFLRASNDDRQTVLRTLFGTRRFADIETVFAERRKQLESRVEGARTLLAQQTAQFAGYLSPDDRSVGLSSDDAEAVEVPNLATSTWIDEGIAALDAESALAETATTAADAAYSASETELRLLTGVRAHQLRRDTARRTLETLAEQSAVVDLDRKAIDAARRAMAVWPSIVASREADAALGAGRRDELEAREIWQEQADSDANPDAAALAESTDRLTRQLGSLADLLADEQRLPSLTASLDAATAELEKGDRVTATRSSATGLEEAHAEVTRLTAAIEHSRTAATLATRIDEAHALEATASGDLLAATQRHHALLDQRVHGQASELARALVAGEPCAVCGATEHPAPATADVEPVTQDDIDAALGVVDSRRAGLAVATKAASELAVSLADARARSDGRSIDELTATLDTARDAAVRISDNVTRVTELETAIGRLREELDSARSRVDALRVEREAASGAVTAARVERDAAAARVAAQLGDFESIAAHATELQGRLDGAQRLATALDTVATREQAATSSRTALEALLAENEFEDADAAEASRMSRGEIDSVDARIREHDQRLATTRATLDERELETVPEGVVELDGAESAIADARSARDAALTARSAVRERASGAARAATAVREQLAASESLLAEFEHVREIAQAVAGREPNTKRMRLETYVLAAQLEEIVAAANARLRTMTSGRYTLEHDDSVQYRNAASGLGLAILDEHTGRSRATHSLSGGETFLASLALALGLAEVVTNQSGGITLDTLFIDEGFGSLDSDTLDIAMGTLDSLRAGGRTIGLISHVGSMKEQIPATLHVSVDARGHSRIETRTGLA